MYIHNCFRSYYILCVGKPTVTALPSQNMELTNNNSTLVLMCSLPENNINFNFRWEKKHKRLPLRAHGVNSQQLTITKLNTKDSGEYRCIVSNSAGIIASDYSVITIKGLELINFVSN